MSSTIRSPSLTVTWTHDGTNTTLPNVITARVRAGFNLRVAEATVTLPGFPVGLMPWDGITITMGATAGTAAVRFTGFYVSTDNQFYPKEMVLVCRGKLALAETLEAETTVDMSSYAATPEDYGHADEIMVATVLYICRLAQGGWTPSETPMTGIEGTGIILGISSGPYQHFNWHENEAGLSFIERLDSICLGYRTYDSFDGTIKRTQITSIPSNSPVATFTEGVDIFRATENVTILDAVNLVRVSGWPGVDSKTEIDHTAQAENPFLFDVDSEPWYITKKVASSMIEKELTADGTPGVGLSCEQVADWLLGELNVYSEKVTMTTPLDTVIEPGDTVAIVAPTRLGIAIRNFWVQEVDPEISRAGAFSQVLNLITSIPPLTGVGVQTGPLGVASLVDLPGLPASPGVTLSSGPTGSRFGITLRAAAAIAKSQSATFSANAAIERSSGEKTITADALLLAPVSGSIAADSAIQAPQSASVTGNAAIEKSSGTKTVTADATIILGGSITADAAIETLTQIKTITADAAVEKSSGTKTVTADATIILGGSITADAVISGDDYMLISEQTPTSTTVTWSSISSAYKHLRIEYVARSDKDSVTYDTMSIRFNNDTTDANYRRTIHFGYGSTTHATEAGDNSICDYLPAASSPSGSTSRGVIWVRYYTDTSFNKQAEVRSTARRDNATIYECVEQCGVEWESTAAINRIDLVLTGSNYVSGSTFRLYGES